MTVTATELERSWTVGERTLKGRAMEMRVQTGMGPMKGAMPMSLDVPDSLVRQEISGAAGPVQLHDRDRARGVREEVRWPRRRGGPERADPPPRPPSVRPVAPASPCPGAPFTSPGPAGPCARVETRAPLADDGALPGPEPPVATIIEPFRIKVVEPIRMTTREERERRSSPPRTGTCSGSGPRTS